MKQIIILSIILLLGSCKTEVSSNIKQNNLSIKKDTIIELDSTSIINFISNKKWVYTQKDSTLSDKTFVVNNNTIIYDNSIEPILCEISSFKKIKKNKYEIIVKKECYSKFYFEIIDIKKEIVLWEYVNLYMNINDRELLITKPYK